MVSRGPSTAPTTSSPPAPPTVISSASTRCLTDDVHICVIQDVIVHPDHQRTGIGSVMVGRCLRVHEHVRQITLMTDEEPVTTAFYQSLGFSPIGELGLAGYIKLAD